MIAQNRKTRWKASFQFRGGEEGWGVVALYGKTDMVIQ